MAPSVQLAKDGIESKNQKRKASAADVGEGAPPRPVKRRASKACQCCRARKVRCNVTEHGAPCTNCRLDEVECIVSESRRKKKHLKDSQAQANNGNSIQDSTNSIRPASRSIASRNSVPIHPDLLRKSQSVESPLDTHVPHSIYQSRMGLNVQTVNTHNYGSPTPSNFSHFPSPMQDYFGASGPKMPSVLNLPYYIKPLPAKIGPDEVAYLEKKGALSVPSNQLRNELISAYIDFVHPYMPLLDINEFVNIIESGNGALGRISLILYQAVMFAGSAFCDMQHLYNAGYTSRKHARKDFFVKTRILYDFDYESDRVSLVQALLLLTYYYETPDDQKDTWHWMGVATSVAHTIGLHRNPDRSNMDTKRSRLWKRIWWSTYMRDRLIALGMRRPTRIKDEDYDVPMITLDDFDFISIPESVTCVPANCTTARDINKQRELAIMCIEKAKLCLGISHVLSNQYCVLNNNQGMVNDRTTMMLLPKKLDPETSEVKTCDAELQKWLDDLPPEAQNRDTFTGNDSIDLHRALLHLVYFTTLSALHRPQVLPAAPATGPLTKAALDLLDVSREKVRHAAGAITSIAQAVYAADLAKYLPTTGVTVLLPAIIIHLLDIKSTDREIRLNSLRGFCACMTVMSKLRDMYAAADYSTAFLEAAIRKAGIQVATLGSNSSAELMHNMEEGQSMHPVTTVEDLVDAGRRLDILGSKANQKSQSVATLTPPPETGFNQSATSTGRGVGFATDLLSNSMPAPALPVQNSGEEEVLAARLHTYLASTPPNSSSAHSHSPHSSTEHTDHDGDETASMGTTLVHAPLSAGMDGLTNNFASTSHLRMFTTAMIPELASVHASGHNFTVTDNGMNDAEFDALVDLNGVPDGNAGDLGASWNFDDGGVHGFTVDMDWLTAANAMDGDGILTE